LEDFLVKNDINAASIHGDRSQMEREEALSFFKSGHCPVLVATDVASRGLSIPNVEYVINYDMPTLIDDYVHRIGRTGRCGARGVATSFIAEKNRSIAVDLLENMREAKQQIPEFLTAIVDSSRSFGNYGNSGSRYGNSYKGKSSGNSRFGANQDVRFSGAAANSSNQSSYTPPSSSSSSSTYTKSAGSTYGVTYGNNSNSNEDKPASTYGVSSGKKITQPVKTFSATSFQPQQTYGGNSALHGVQAQDDTW
jgi:ATP-dependent RNA helicase DDX3X